MGVTDDLDDLAAAVFGGEAGLERLDPLGRQFDNAVGRLPRDDPHWARWQVLRTDWALCEAELDRPGDTWARRAAAGGVPDVPAQPRWRVVAATQAGLYQVWPGRKPWVREALRGLAGPLPGHAPVDGADEGQPVALWDVHVAWDKDGARVCRQPWTYPLELVSWLEDRRLAGLTGQSSPSLLELRRGCLRLLRHPRLSVTAAFGL